MAACSLAYILATGIRGSLAGNISSCLAVWLSLELLVTLTNPLVSADTELGAVQQTLIQSLSMLVRGSSIVLESVHISWGRIWSQVSNTTQNWTGSDGEYFIHL